MALLAEPTLTIPVSHTITVSLSILVSVGSGVVAVLKALDKYATNHFDHMKKDVIASGNENTKDIVTAIDKMGDKVVIAVLQAK